MKRQTIYDVKCLFLFLKFNRHKVLDETGFRWIVEFLHSVIKCCSLMLPNNFFQIHRKSSTAVKSMRQKNGVEFDGEMTMA